MSVLPRPPSAAAKAAVRAAMLEHQPLVAASYAQLVRGQCERAFKELGPKLARISNSWTWARVYYNTLIQFLDTAKDGTRTLNDERLQKAAAEYAELVVREWEAKIAVKLGELEEAEVRSLATSGRLTIVGKRAGRRVRMDQDRIINVSTKGTLFHQFPARLYIDDKFHSAAKYDKLFAV